MKIFVESVLIGLAIAAPVGPIGMLCIQRTLQGGFFQAFCVGLGAALADGVYGIIASFGVSSLTKILISYTSWIQCFGGLFLIFLGISEFRKKQNSQSVIQKNSILDVFILTLTNPMTILSFIGIFASLSQGPLTYYDSLTMVIGVFSGSMLWWCILGILIVFLKHKFPSPWISNISRISSFILVLFGIFSIIKSIKSL